MNDYLYCGHFYSMATRAMNAFFNDYVNKDVATLQNLKDMIHTEKRITKREFLNYVHNGNYQEIQQLLQGKEISGFYKSRLCTRTVYYFMCNCNRYIFKKNNSE